jgi:hypothetical protein
MIQNGDAPKVHELGSYAALCAEVAGLATQLPGIYVSSLCLTRTAEGLVSEATLAWDASPVGSLIVPEIYLQGPEPRPGLNDLSRMALASMGKPHPTAWREPAQLAVLIEDSAPSRLSRTPLRRGVVAACLKRADNFGWAGNPAYSDASPYGTIGPGCGENGLRTFESLDSFSLRAAWKSGNLGDIINFLASITWELDPKTPDVLPGNRWLRLWQTIDNGAMPA